MKAVVILFILSIIATARAGVIGYLGGHGPYEAGYGGYGAGYGDYPWGHGHGIYPHWGHHMIHEDIHVPVPYVYRHHHHHHYVPQIHVDEYYHEHGHHFGDHLHNHLDNHLGDHFGHHWPFYPYFQNGIIGRYHDHIDIPHIDSLDHAGIDTHHIDHHDVVNPNLVH